MNSGDRGQKADNVPPAPSLIVRALPPLCRACTWIATPTFFLSSRCTYSATTPQALTRTAKCPANPPGTGSSSPMLRRVCICILSATFGLILIAAGMPASSPHAPSPISLNSHSPCSSTGKEVYDIGSEKLVGATQELCGIVQKEVFAVATCRTHMVFTFNEILRKLT